MKRIQDLKDKIDEQFAQKISYEIQARALDYAEDTFGSDATVSIGTDSTSGSPRDFYYVWDENGATTVPVTKPLPVEDSDESLDGDVGDFIKEILENKPDHAEVKKENRSQLEKVDTLIDSMIASAKCDDQFKEDLDQVYKYRHLLGDRKTFVLSEAQLKRLNEIYKRWK